MLFAKIMMFLLYIESKLTTSYVFFAKYSIVKEYLYICVNNFEYGRKFNSLNEI